MKKIIKTASKLHSKTVLLDELYHTYVRKHMNKIMSDVSHPLHQHYVLLRSGKRLALPRLHTNTFKNSFIPKSIKLYSY